MPFNLGGPELIIILVIVLVVFGAGKLPNVMKDLGTGVREFKKAQDDVNNESRAPQTITMAAPAAPVANAPVVSSAAPVVSHTVTSAGPASAAAARPMEAAPRA